MLPSLSNKSLDHSTLLHSPFKPPNHLFARLYANFHVRVWTCARVFMDVRACMCDRERERVYKTISVGILIATVGN